jgi:ABC-type microcin C transport system permease subunit YejB
LIVEYSLAAVSLPGEIFDLDKLPGRTLRFFRGKEQYRVSLSKNVMGNFFFQEKTQQRKNKDKAPVSNRSGLFIFFKIYLVGGASGLYG